MINILLYIFYTSGKCFIWTELKWRRAKGFELYSSSTWYEFIVQDVIYAACIQWHTKVVPLSQQGRSTVCSESENKIILMTIRILLIAHEVISINKSSHVLQRSHLSHKTNQMSPTTFSDATPGAHAGKLLHKCKCLLQFQTHDISVLLYKSL